MTGGPLITQPLSFSMRLSLLVLFAVAGTLLPVRALGAPVTFNTALPVAEGEAIVRIQSRYLRSSGDPTAKDRELTVWAGPIVIAYGVTAELTLFGIVPYLDKELELDIGSERRTRGASGLGDTTFMARYIVWKRDRPGETIRIAPFAALKAPTGDDDEKDVLGQLPRPLQLGSGSWDYTLGAITTWQTLRRQIDGSLSYRFNSKADGFRFGDEALVELSFQHRFLPRKLASGLPAFLYGVLESSLVWQGENEMSGVVDEDSGGTTLYLTPALQYVTKRIVVEAAIQLPALQELNGSALENDFIGILSFRANF